MTKSTYPVVNNVLVGVYFLQTNSPSGFALVGIVAENITCCPIGRPNDQSGSGNENLNMNVSEVILIFLASLRTTLPS